MPSHGSVKDKDRGYNALMKRLGKKAPVMYVGIPAAAGAEPKKEGNGKTSTHMSLVEVAYIHEFGAPEQSIPQRSFIRAWFDENSRQANAKATSLLHGVISGKVEQTHVMDMLGAWAAGSIKKRMSKGIAPDLAESTVKARQNPKNKDDSKAPVPLIATGQLRSAITWVLRDE